MTKTKGFFLGVLVFTLLPFSAFAQEIAQPSESRFDAARSIGFKVLPNPIRDNAKFVFDQGGDKNWNVIYLTIFSLLGEPLYQVTGEQFECSKNLSRPCTLEHDVDFSPLQTGLYLVEIGAEHSLTKETVRRTLRAVYDQK